MRCLLGWRASPEGRHRNWRRCVGGVEAVRRSRPGAAGPGASDNSLKARVRTRARNAQRAELDVQYGRTARADHRPGARHMGDRAHRGLCAETSGGPGPLTEDRQKPARRS